MGSFLRKILRLRTLLTLLSIISSVALILAYVSAIAPPTSFHYLPMFGLTYRITFSVCVVLLCLWALLKSLRGVLLLSLVIVLGGTIHFRTFPMGWDDQNKNETVELRVLSYNVRLFDLYNPSFSDGLQTRNQIFDFLKNEKADLYCFQEFYNQQPPSRFQTKDTLISLLQTPYLHSRFSPKDVRRQEFGVVLLSKHRIIQQGEVSFSAVQRTDNYCIFADIVKEQDTFRVYNAHLQSIKLQKDDYALFHEDNIQSAEESSQWLKLLEKIMDAYPIRVHQAKKVLEHIETSPYPVIVCGDFNDTPMSNTYHQFNQVLQDAYRNTSRGVGGTYAGKIPAGRIDFIFHSESLGSKNFAIQKERLSDHYAISCTVFKE